MSSDGRSVSSNAKKSKLNAKASAFVFKPSSSSSPLIPLSPALAPANSSPEAKKMTKLSARAKPFTFSPSATTFTPSSKPSNPILTFSGVPNTAHSPSTPQQPIHTQQRYLSPTERIANSQTVSTPHVAHTSIPVLASASAEADNDDSASKTEESLQEAEEVDEEEDEDEDEEEDEEEEEEEEEDEEEKESTPTEDISPREKRRRQSEKEEEEQERKLGETLKNFSTYDRNKLMAIQERVKRKPKKAFEDMVKNQLESIFSDPRRSAQHQRGPPQGYQQRRDHRANNNRGGAGGRGPRGKKPHGNRRGGNRQDAPLDIEFIPLERTENAYSRRTKSDMSTIDADQKLLREMKSMLNKLTPDNFDTLVDKAQDLPINNQYQLQETVNAVFEKALAEPVFASTYAKFCRRLYDKLPEFEDEEESKTFSFRGLILSKCQHEFEKEKPETDEDDEMTLMLAKRRTLGTIRFIGELFMQNMISPKIIIRCMTILLGDVEDPNEENIEALCHLLATVGLKMESDDKRGQNVKALDYCYTQMKILSGKKEALDSRHRFMIQDSMDLRRNNWVDRRAKPKAKKLSEIHKEAEAEKAAAAAAAARQKSSKYDRGAPPPRKREKVVNTHSRYSAQKAPTSSTEWQSAPRSKRAGGSQDIRASQDKFSSSRRGRDSPSLRGGGMTKRGGSSAFFRASARQNAAQVQTKAKPSRTGFAALTLGDEEEDEETDEEESDEEESDEEESDEEESDEQSEEEDEESDLDADPVPGSRRDVKYKMRKIVAEFWRANDVPEVRLCIEELPTKKYNYLIVSEGFTNVMEESAREREKLPTLVLALVESKHVSSEELEKGVERFLSDAPNFVIDIPLLPRWTGEMLAPIIDKSSLTVQTVAELASGKLQARHVAAILACVVAGLKTLGQDVSGFFEGDGSLVEVMGGAQEAAKALKRAGLEDLAESL